MTEQEAIKWVNDRMCYGRGKWSKNHMPEIDEYWQAGTQAMEALKKQIPKKPRVKTFDFTGQPGVKPNTVIRKYICPNCGYVYGELMLMSYCGACGQKIDHTKGEQ